MSSQLKYTGIISDGLRSSSFMTEYKEFYTRTSVEYSVNDTKNTTLTRYRVVLIQPPPGMDVKEYRNNRVVQKVVRGSAVDWMQQESSKMGWPPKIRTDPRLHTQDWSSSVYSYGNKGSGDYATSDDRSILNIYETVLQEGMLPIKHSDQFWLVDPRGEYVKGNITLQEVGALFASYPFRGVQYG